MPSDDLAAVVADAYARTRASGSARLSLGGRLYWSVPGVDRFEEIYALAVDVWLHDNRLARALFTPGWSTSSNSGTTASTSPTSTVGRRHNVLT